MDAQTVVTNLSSAPRRMVQALGFFIAVALLSSILFVSPAAAHVDPTDEPDVVVALTPTVTANAVPASSPTDWILGPLLNQYAERDSWIVNCAFGKAARFKMLVGEGDFTFTARGFRQDGTSWKRHAHAPCPFSNGCDVTADVEVGPNKRIYRGVVSHPSFADIYSGRCL